MSTAYSQFPIDFPRVFLGLHYNKGLKEPAREWNDPPTDCEPDVAVKPRVHKRFITHPRPVT